MDMYKSVTDSIISELEKGAIPWVKPWKADGSADKNFISQKPYQGINRLLLGMSSMAKGYSNPAWATYKQWADSGTSVKTGEKATHIVFFKPVKSTDKATGKDSNYCVIKGYAVFNVQQTDMDIIPSETPDAPFNPIPSCEDRIIKTGASISHGGDAAFYMPSQDRIQLPNKGAFTSECHYYATAFHELSHWTGAKHRLDRNLDNGKYGNPAYAFEELVAEISAAYLCADYKIQGELRHAGYIQSWLKACKEDSKAIFKAAALAQKATDYIQGLDVTVESIAA
ncbi:COG4227 Antirestriction protein [uncultured Caudovirales phage]|uniref:COG4227 Antirestriction protein n=1 Tax=uncultured Caudovirales phage TaxID=2100421 RepID=A0A6J5QV68_9CAUD|nr:COG4227 Antirestriction protein [uncultured Caudovirales phage]